MAFGSPLRSCREGKVGNDMARVNSDEVIQECALVGAAIIAAQRVEFLLYGVISHLAGLPEHQNSRFRTLDPEKFLRGDAKDLKATLGQLVEWFGDKLLLTTEDLDKFVKDRNLIAHNYFRLTKARIKGGDALKTLKNS